MDLFEQSAEYPSISGTILPYGTLYEYISSTFLNGFINYVDIQYIIASNRYWDEEDFNELGDWGKFIDSESYEIGFHTDLSIYRSDICCFGTDKNGDYVFFYFDQDVSDCCIGRLRKHSTNFEQLSQYSREFALNIAKNYQKIPKIKQIPKPTGWVKF